MSLLKRIVIVGGSLSAIVITSQAATLIGIGDKVSLLVMLSLFVWLLVTAYVMFEVPIKKVQVVTYESGEQELAVGYSPAEVEQIVNAAVVAGVNASAEHLHRAYQFGAEMQYREHQQALDFARACMERYDLMTQRVIDRLFNALPQPEQYALVKQMSVPGTQLGFNPLDAAEGSYYEVVSESGKVYEPVLIRGNKAIAKLTPAQTKSWLALERGETDGIYSVEEYARKLSKEN